MKVRDSVACPFAFAYLFENTQVGARCGKCSAIPGPLNKCVTRVTRTYQKFEQVGHHTSRWNMRNNMDMERLFCFVLLVLFQGGGGEERTDRTTFQFVRATWLDAHCCKKRLAKRSCPRRCFLILPSDVETLDHGQICAKAPSTPGAGPVQGTANAARLTAQRGPMQPPMKPPKGSSSMAREPRPSGKLLKKLRISKQLS